MIDTDLSPYMIIAFSCSLAAMVWSLLTVVFEEDKTGVASFSQADIKSIILMAMVAAVLCAIFAVNMNTVVTARLRPLKLILIPTH